MSVFGERLKQVRERKGLSQAKVADDLNIGRSAYNNYEMCRREPDIETVVKISKYLDISVGYLCGSTDYEQPDNLINLYENGIKVWIEDQFFSAKESDRLKEHYIDLLLRYKKAIEAIEKAKVSQRSELGDAPNCEDLCNYYIGRCSYELEQLTGWASSLLLYFLSTSYNMGDVSQIIKAIKEELDESSTFEYESPSDIAAHTESAMTPEMKAEVEKIARQVYEKYSPNSN